MANNALMRLVICALLICAFLCAAARAEDTAKPSEQCVTLGSAVQGSCDSDLKKATAFFGGSTSPSEEKVNSYISDTSVSDSCCSDAKAFNAAGCNSEASVQELGAAFVGTDVSTYNRVYSALAQICGF
ncbi:hypothetical protein FOA52_010579 [Chlamydomonas sp. UWO 241]|nr:hypothetical protein FOA52_010579 [Chlamydomonas sp. UWO 241]